MFPSNILLALVLAVTVVEISFTRVEAKIDVYSLGQANNYFAANLHRKLSAATEENVFFSPFAVSSTLAMLYNGARGKTAKELRSVLGYGKLDDPTILSSFQFYLAQVIGKMNPKIYTINCISAMIVDNSFPLLPWYKSEMRNVFEAYVQDANLVEEAAAVVDKMNTWAKIKTKGTICSLADGIDPETTLFLASAAYFKGAWTIKFEPQDTKYHPFFNDGQRSNYSNVLMMHCYASVRYFDDEDEDFTAVELYYEGRDISMVIYLPNEIDGLSDLEQSLTSEKLGYARRQSYHIKVHLTMPKFKLETEISLTTALKELGLSQIFRFGADLSGMIPRDESLALSDVQHKASIEVNEDGSIAAAITRMIMTKSMSLPIPDPEFRVDHPFLFAIFDTRSNLILFMGRITRL